MSEEPLKIQKRGFPMSFSWESLVDTPAPEPIGYEPVTDEQWKQYRRAKKLLKEMDRNPYIRFGYDGDIWVEKPRPKPIYGD